MSTASAPTSTPQSSPPAAPAKTGCHLSEVAYRPGMAPFSSYYTAEELMDRFRCSRRQLKTLRERGGLPHWRPEGAREFLYPAALTDAWEVTCLVEPTIAERVRRSDAGCPVKVAPRHRSTRQAEIVALRPGRRLRPRRAAASAA